MSDLQLEPIEILIYQANYGKALSTLKEYEDTNKLSNNDHLKLKYLKSLYFLRKGLNKEGKKAAEEFLKISEELLDPMREIDALFHLGSFLSNLGEPEAAIERISRAKKLLPLLSTEHPIEIQTRKADLLCLEGIILRTRGESTKALEVFQKSLFFREKIGNEIKIIDSHVQLALTFYHGLNAHKVHKTAEKCMKLSKALKYKRGVALANLGFGAVHRLRGELQEAIVFFEQGLKIAQELEDLFVTSFAVDALSGVYFDLGELNKGLDLLDKLEVLNKKTGNFWYETTVFNNRGAIQMYMGEVDNALNNLSKSLAYGEKIGNVKGLIINLLNIGEVFSMMGDDTSSIEYLERSINMAKEHNFGYGHSTGLFTLIRYHHRSLSKDRMDDILTKFKQLSEIHSDLPYVSQQYRLSKAIVLTYKGRLSDKIAAQAIFKEISEEDCIHLENTVVALLYLSELLLFELETTGNNTALEELNRITQRLLKVAKIQHAYPYMSEAFLIQSKLKLIAFDIEESQRLLSQAHLITEEKGLHRLSRIISIEEEAMLKLFHIWEKILDQKPSISDIIKISRVEDLLRGVSQNKLYQNEEEVIAYADKALQIAKAWKT